MRLGLRIGALSLALSALGCNLTQTGEAPPRRTLNFPIAAALSNSDGGPAERLVVVNSNFDLRFNTGTLLSLDLAVLRSRFEADGCATTSCEYDTLDEALVSDEVAIGSHATGVTLNAAGNRLYVPVRAERNLTYVDFDPSDGTFACNAAIRGSDPVPRCDEAFRRGRDGAEITSERELVLAGDPVAVATALVEDVGGEPGDGEVVLVALRDGRVAMFLDDFSNAAPVLVHVAGGFPEGLVTLTLQPGRGVGWMTSSGTDLLARVGIALDPVRTRSFLFDAGARRVGGIDDGEDLRDLVFHPSEPTAYVLSRRPEAVVAVDLDRTGLTSLDLGLGDVWEVGQGPSRLELAEIGGRTYVFASCFNAQKIFIIDVDQGSLVNVVGGFSGPFELVIDEAAQHLYLVDFATSVLRVLDLSPLTENATPALLATLGQPFAPSGL